MASVAGPAGSARAFKRLGIVGRAGYDGARPAVATRPGCANVVGHLAVDAGEALGTFAHVLVRSGALARPAVLARLVSAAVVQVC